MSVISTTSTSNMAIPSATSEMFNSMDTLNGPFHAIPVWANHRADIPMPDGGNSWVPPGGRVTVPSGSSSHLMNSRQSYSGMAVPVSVPQIGNHDDENGEDVFVDIALDDDSDSSHDSAGLVNFSSTEASGSDSDPGSSAWTRGVAENSTLRNDLSGSVRGLGADGFADLSSSSASNSTSAGVLSSYFPSFSVGRYRRGGFWV
jgi:hypothetical protein